MRKIALFVLALLWVAVPAAADSIGPNCDTCAGSIYTLEYSYLGTNGVDSFFDIFFEVDMAAYTGGGTLLDAVAFKVSSSDPTGISLVSAPNGASNWTVVPGGLNSGGCDNAGSGFVCAQANTLADAAAVKGTYIWEFSITLPNGAIFLNTNEASIKALYADDTGKKAGPILSENITLQPKIPEPGTLALFGSGLLGLARAARRRMK